MAKHGFAFAFAAPQFVFGLGLHYLCGMNEEKAHLPKIEVVAAVIEHDGAFLATQRGYGEQAGGWEFPGGKIEPGETPRQALVREIQEELGVTVNVGRSLLVVEWDYPAFHLTMHCFMCSLPHGHIELHEHRSARWLTPAQLRQVPWLPADVAVVDCLEQERSFTVRSATPADIDTLLHLADRARHIMRASGNRLQWTGGYPTREILARDVELGFSQLMLHRGQPAASFAFIPGPDPTYDYIEDGHWLDERQPYHVIHRIASSGEHKGVIAAMMAFAARHGHNVRIDTHADNAIMQHLLARHGFTRCGVIYLANGEPRLAYQKTDN